MEYEAELTVPAEQYGNIRPKVKGTPEQIVAAYRAFAEELRPKPVNEMPVKDFNAILDDLLDDHSIAGDPGELEKMSPAQQGIIQAIKRSLKRLNK